MAKKFCKGESYHDRMGFLHCGRTVPDGVDFCSSHDPKKVQAREAERRRKFEAEMKADDDREAAAERLCRRLGAGHPDFSSIGRGGYTGGIALTAAEAEALIVRLKKGERNG